VTGLLAFLAERRAELLALTGQHVVLVLVSTALAVLIGLPLGIAMTRSERLARVLLGLAGLAQTIPSLALFGFLIPLPFVGGIGARTAIIALVLYALLPILRNTYTGIRQVDPAVLEAATGMGMTAGQRLRLVELPLALPVILAGVRIAAVVSVGTATIAAAIGAGGLGTYVFRGLATVDARLILAGAIPAALLALLIDGLLAAVERSPRPFRAAATLAIVTAAVIALLLGGSARPAAPAVVVGSKNFTEQVLLGEILAAHLETRGFTVDRRLNLGGTALCHEAVRAGQIDVYVEYTGTALTDVLKRPARSDAGEVLREVREGYRRLGLEVGEPLGFNNTFALVMRKDPPLGPVAAHGHAARRALRGVPGKGGRHAGPRARLRPPFRRAASRDGPRPAVPGARPESGGSRRGQRHGRADRRPRPAGARGRSALLPALRRGDDHERGKPGRPPRLGGRPPRIDGSDRRGVDAADEPRSGRQPPRAGRGGPGVPRCSTVARTPRIDGTALCRGVLPNRGLIQRCEQSGVGIDHPDVKPSGFCFVRRGR